MSHPEYSAENKLCTVRARLNRVLATVGLTWLSGSTPGEEHNDKQH